MDAPTQLNTSLVGTGNSGHLCVAWAEQMKTTPVCGASDLDVSDGMQANVGQSKTETLTRTIIEMDRYSRSKKFYFKGKPLLHFIPTDRVIIDNLHLFARISGLLIDLLSRELKSSDTTEKKKAYSYPQIPDTLSHKLLLYTTRYGDIQ